MPYWSSFWIRCRYLSCDDELPHWNVGKVYQLLKSLSGRDLSHCCECRALRNLGISTLLCESRVASHVANFSVTSSSCSSSLPWFWRGGGISFVVWGPGDWLGQWEDGSDLVLNLGSTKVEKSWTRRVAGSSSAWSVQNLILISAVCQFARVPFCAAVAENYFCVCMFFFFSSILSWCLLNEVGDLYRIFIN